MIMRTLVNRERTAVVDFLDEIDTQLAAARARTNAATDGNARAAHVELDFARSALDEIVDIAEVLTGYLNRLIPSTENAKQATSGHGLVPPRRGVYTFDGDDGETADESDDKTADAGTEVAA